MVAATRIDGRVQRGERTRAAIVDAFLSLLEEEGAAPPAHAIADRAGVSLRSVFQHFADMEALYAVCVARQHERLAALRPAIDSAWSRSKRIDTFVAARARLYERIAPVRRAAVAVAPSSAAIRAGLTEIAGEHRADVEQAFATELAGAAREVRSAVEVATCFDTWDHLRRAQGLSVAAAKRTTIVLVKSVLEECA